MGSKNKWWLNLYPSTYFIVAAVLVGLVITLVSCGQAYQAQIRVNETNAMLARKAQVSAARIAELQSLPSTEVVTELGPKGDISYYWGMSGLSSKYSLDEYLAAVKAPRGANVYAPVEGDHFIVPWIKSGKP